MTNLKEILNNLINDERNSALFYSFLASISEDKNAKQSLENIAIECGYNAALLISFAKKSGIRFYADFGTIEKNISFENGVKWAVTIEEESLEKLSGYIGEKVFRSVYEKKKKRINTLKKMPRKTR